MCDNKVTQFVPRGYGFKEIESRCGSIGINGNNLMCDECLERYSKKYPQGWKEIPGDVCVHGNYVGNDNGVDYMCGECEMGY